MKKVYKRKEDEDPFPRLSLGEGRYREGCNVFQSVTTQLAGVFGYKLNTPLLIPEYTQKRVFAFVLLQIGKSLWVKLQICSFIHK